jgi:hypothetical protein
MKLRSPHRALVALALAVLVLAPAAIARADHDSKSDWKGAKLVQDWSWVGAIAPGQELEIKNVNGGVEAEPAKGTQAEVEATKRGRKQNPEDVKIEVIKHARGITVCVVYPTPSGSPPNECKPGEGGRMNVRNNDVNVDFRLKVPKGVNLVVRTVNGSVHAEALDGDVEVFTVNGSVTVSTQGSASAKTVNGSVDAALGRAGSRETLRFETVNGSVTVEIPETMGANVSAETVNGRISTDLPITVQGRFSSRSISGTLGKGGTELVLRTVNGAIRLRSLGRGSS